MPACCLIEAAAAAHQSLPAARLQHRHVAQHLHRYAARPQHQYVAQHLHRFAAQLQSQHAAPRQTPAVVRVWANVCVECSAVAVQLAVVRLHVDAKLTDN